MKGLSYKVWATVLLVVAGAVAGSAQFNQAKTPTPSNDGMTSELIKTGLFLISGNGSNSVLRLSASGLILVDGKPAASYAALRARARKISDQPIRALVLTGCDKSRTGTNAKLVDDGTHIIAQENIKLNLGTCNLAGDSFAPAMVAYGSEYPIHMGGVEAQVLHFGNAYSNRDTVVYFPNLKVVVIGDLFAAEPAPDFAAGGSLVGWGPVLAQILKLDFDTVVPGQGPVITRADLQAFKTKIDTMVARATGLVKQGVPKDQLMAQLKTGDPVWQLNFTGEQLDSFYAELARAKSFDGCKIVLQF